MKKNKYNIENRAEKEGIVKDLRKTHKLTADIEMSTGHVLVRDKDGYIGFCRTEREAAALLAGFHAPAEVATGRRNVIETPKGTLTITDVASGSVLMEDLSRDEATRYEAGLKARLQRLER